MDRLSDNRRDADGIGSYEFWCAAMRLRREAEEGRRIAALAERIAEIARRIAEMEART